jgi:hypothetical protein
LNRREYRSQATTIIYINGSIYIPTISHKWFYILLVYQHLQCMEK